MPILPAGFQIPATRSYHTILIQIPQHPITYSSPSPRNTTTDNLNHNICDHNTPHTHLTPRMTCCAGRHIWPQAWSSSPMSLHLAPKYFGTTKAASHTTQLTSTFFWHNVQDLPQLLISNFLIKIPTIFTCTLTSNSFNWTSPDLHQLSESSHGAHAKISTNSVLFFCSSTKFAITNAPTLMSRVWRRSKNHGS